LDTPFGPLPARHLAQMSMADRHEHLQRGAISRRRFLRGAAVSGGVLLAGPTLWQQTARASMPPMSPHLQVGADPRSTMVVSWATTGPVARPVVDRLAPGTRYRYRIAHDGATGEPSTFRTAPGAAEPFTFTAFGDQGVSAGAQETTATVAAQDPAFHFHVGDLCYAYQAGGLFEGPTEQAVWDDWFAQVSRGAAARIPWMPTVGNHEMESAPT
jgi:phosphodiesterase/alkaline phosphatase D-like protein